jgi:hypothetical protein
MVSDKVLGYYLGDDSRGGNCLLPMAFEHSLKITLSGNKDIFYHILWEQYPVGGGMTGEALAKSISAAQDIWLPPVPQKTAHPENIQQICLLPGKKVTFFEKKGLPVLLPSRSRVDASNLFSRMFISAYAGMTRCMTASMHRSAIL